MILLYFPILTVIVSLSLELIVLLFLKKKNPLFISLFIITNIITNILMNNILLYFSNYTLGLIILELAVFIIEGLIYSIILKDIKKAFIISLLCNLSSLFGGILFNVILGGLI